ncbi:MAG: 2-keto-4-pentenoate hydratase [Hyphomicrobiaceae bacterium]
MATSELARRLWQARLDGTVIDAATVTPPASTEAAYALQAEITALSGCKVLGFKVGSTSIEAQKFLGTDEPGSAPLLAPYMFESPADVAVSAPHMPAVEGEFAFKLANDLPLRTSPYTREDIADAVAAVAGSIEVVGTRFKGGLAGKGRLLTTADGGVNIALVAGRWERNWRNLDLPAHGVTMRVNGVLKGSGNGARALGDPMHVMVWLVNQQSRWGRGMKAGDIVCTGTCTGLDAVRPGDRVSAEFGSLGTVDITFRAM